MHNLNTKESPLKSNDKVKEEKNLGDNDRDSKFSYIEEDSSSFDLLWGGLDE